MMREKFHNTEKSMVRVSRFERVTRIGRHSEHLPHNSLFFSGRSQIIVAFYKLEDERKRKDQACWVCGEAFHEGDLIVCERHGFSRRFYHGKCFNHSRQRLEE